MTEDAAYLRSLEFVRSAIPTDDSSVVKEGGSLWRHPDGDFVWMHPSGVMQHGLTEKMREGLAQESQFGISPELRALPQSAEGINPAADATNIPQFAQIVGGHTTDWRWSVVDHEDGQTLAIDNWPRVDRAKKAEEPAVEYEKIRIPAPDFLAIANSLA